MQKKIIYPLWNLGNKNKLIGSLLQSSGVSDLRMLPFAIPIPLCIGNCDCPERIL